ncbi:MAG: ribonuclease H-like domain-containing protein [Lactobacillus sp.]|jgi:DNA polymerase III epsilon subunit family exonuclease|nr:ribonuclease H-like domain-containing protein [Lactobacillus sp.]MCH4067989.1 ribonuclease H-like domain-containing protein [Lactobacillus sp.]MCI1304055.1 ribonuclease H-like domain-containing protein [Lactobacillus sp.]MCI1329919.1 ribonuclease H-like domain-containing protein [Lactobacillus sp.]MCI1399519.1 ribonuclease H-like domain-containing protein [Lactobacillus sp.]
MKNVIGWIILIAILFLAAKWLFTTPVGIATVIVACIAGYCYYKVKNKDKVSIKPDKMSVKESDTKEPKQITDKKSAESKEATVNSKKNLKVLNESADNQKATENIESPKVKPNIESSKAESSVHPTHGTATRFSINDHKDSNPNSYSVEIAPGLYSTMTSVGPSKHDHVLPKIFNAKNTKNFIVLDTETTGLSTSHDKILQLAALKFEDDKLVDTFNQYINPEKTPISENARLVHGITEDDVKDKPTFDKVIPQFQKFVGENSVWVGHNINNFDIPIMFNNGYRQKGKFTTNEFYTIDTCTMAKQEMAELGLKNFKLETLKDYFGLSGNSHNALGDCQVTAGLYKKLRDGDLAKTEKHSDKIFDGIRFCISGQFKEASKYEIKQMIELHGGKVTGSVSHKTNYLIDGKQVSTHLTDGVHSSSELKAEEYGVPKIGYSDLMKMLADAKH